MDKPDPLYALLGLRDFTIEYCSEAWDFMTRCLTTPAPDSSLARSLTAREQHGVYTVAWQYLVAGVDHLTALTEVLHGSHESVVVPQAACFTLERACLESSAFAIWLLDPSLPEDVSIARGLMARVRNLRERQKIDPNGALREEGLREIKRVAHAYGLPLDQAGKYPKHIGSVPVNTRATDVCSHALSLIHTPGEDYGWVYSLLSGYAHGLGYALALNVSGWQWVGHLKLGMIEPPVEKVLLCGTAVARAHHKALEMLGQHAGLHDVPASVDIRTDTPWF